MRATLPIAVALAAVSCGRGSLAPSTAELLAACPECPISRYQPKDGFVVHEWGTLTSVMGSDGALLPGLHHEEEDLPGFVADRVAQAAAYPSSNTLQKMETPVTYFYAPEAKDVRAFVSFPNGLLTQWFPYVKAMSPALYVGNGTPVDAWLSSSRSVPPSCQASFTRPLGGGLLDWGEFKVLPRDVHPELAGPVGDHSWRFARNVGANALEVVAPDGLSVQREQFLFYRGLGDFGLPVTVRFEAERLRINNAHRATQAVSQAVLMNVTAAGAGFTALGSIGFDEVAAQIPAPAQSHADFAVALKAKLMELLVADGLYTDEAKAMVDTWERSYFHTPGVRLLYLLPQAVTDNVLPLTIWPAPATLRRTMVIRVELLSPGYEARLSSSLTALASPSTSAEARATFLGLGRFAEPQLTRALQLTAVQEEQAAAESLLAEIRGQRRWAPVTAD